MLGEAKDLAITIGEQLTKPEKAESLGTIIWEDTTRPEEILKRRKAEEAVESMAEVKNLAAKKAANAKNEAMVEVTNMPPRRPWRPRSRRLRMPWRPW